MMPLTGLRARELNQYPPNMDAPNANHNNPGPIIGNITSPLFGKANQEAGPATQIGASLSESATNRRLEFQIRFTF